MTLNGNLDEYNFLVGYLVLGGDPNIVTSETIGHVITANGAGVIGSSNSAATITASSSFLFGGDSITVTINGVGCSSVHGSGIVGVDSSDANLLLLGGSGTELYGNGGTSQSVCIGSSTATQTFSPTASQTFIKGNPLIGLSGSSGYTSTSTIATADFAGGFITFAPTGVLQTFTTPTATDMYAYMVDNSAATFSLNMMFTVMVQNTSAFSCTFAAGTGVTLQGASTILSTGSLVLHCVFLSATTMLIRGM